MTTFLGQISLNKLYNIVLSVFCSGTSVAKCFWTSVALSASSYRATGSGQRAAAMLQARRRSSEGALFALPLAKSVTERVGERDKWRSAD